MAIFLACFAGSPKLFWWFELVPLTIVAALTIAWHRRAERSLLGATATRPDAPPGMVAAAPPE
jgi:hypothetical protein